MDEFRFPSGSSQGRFSSWKAILISYPILAMALLMVVLSEDLPTDEDGRPTILSFFAIIIVLSVPVIFIIRSFASLFSRTVREKLTQHKRIDALWAISVFFVVLSIFIPGSGHPNFKSKGMREWYTNLLLMQVYSSILNYEAEYGSFPPTSNNRDIARILEGDNPRKIEFINLKPWAINPAGDLIDRWDTPIRITLADPKNPVVQSAGPDRIWHTSDDLTGTTNIP